MHRKVPGGLVPLGGNMGVSPTTASGEIGRSTQGLHGLCGEGAMGFKVRCGGLVVRGTGSADESIHVGLKVFRFGGTAAADPAARFYDDVTPLKQGITA